MSHTQGKPTKLESQFRLTYSMILNLLRVEQLRVEDMIKRSFSEFHQQKDVAKHKTQLDELHKKIAEIRNIECFLCCVDLERYHETCRDYLSLKRHLQVRLIESSNVTTLWKGEEHPIHVSMICNPWKGLPCRGCCKSWTRGWDFLVLLATWCLIIFLLQVFDKILGVQSTISWHHFLNILQGNFYNQYAIIYNSNITHMPKFLCLQDLKIEQEIW